MGIGDDKYRALVNAGYTGSSQDAEAKFWAVASLDGLGGTPEWGDITGDINDNAALVAALGSPDIGGPSDPTNITYTIGPPRLIDTYTCDGLVWTVAYNANGSVNTCTHGSLVRQYVYDGNEALTGVTGPRFQGGSLALTYAQMDTVSPSAPGLKVMLTDTYPRQELVFEGDRFKSPSGVFGLYRMGKQRILMGASGSPTYSQTAFTITVTRTGHGYTAARNNGADIYLTVSTGTLVSGWFSNFTYVDANTFTCTSTISQSISGNLGVQTGEVTFDTITLKAKLMGPNGTVRGRFLVNAFANNANAKTFRVRWAGTPIFNPSLASTLTMQTDISISNQNNVAKQVNYGTSSSTQNGTSSAAPNDYTVNTDTGDVTILVTGQLGNSADNLILESCILSICFQLNYVSSIS